MSYEGRVYYLCKNGHTKVVDSYDDYYSEFADAITEDIPKSKICPFCKTSLKRIGGVDDTNGDAQARFYLKQLTKEEYSCEYDTENMSCTTYYKPATYEAVITNRWFNFEKMNEKYSLK